VYAPSMLGSLGFNGAMPNQVDSAIEEWLAVDIDDMTYEVLHCVDTVHRMWGSLLAENQW